MPRKKAPWTLVFMSYPCPTCGVGPGQRCRSTSGRPRNEFHVDRTRLGERCPKCGALTDADAEPGTLCDRCALIRRLEIERATVHRRLT